MSVVSCRLEDSKVLEISLETKIQVWVLGVSGLAATTSWQNFWNSTREYPRQKLHLLNYFYRTRLCTSVFMSIKC